MKSVIVIGGGVGGLASAALLSSKGYDVTVYEKNATIGGRSARLTVGDFSFDTGPTFLIYKEVLIELFEAMQKNIEDYVDIKTLDPLYSLVFDKTVFRPSNLHREHTVSQIEDFFPGNSKGYNALLKDQQRRFASIARIMRMPFDKPYHYLHPKIIKGVPHINPFKNLRSQLKGYFNNEQMIQATGFQSKYLGLSAEKTPALFAILSYLEHAHGLYHTIGGLNAINHAFAKVIKEHGGKIHTSTGVKKIHAKKRQITHITLDSNDDVQADGYFLNADFAKAMLDMVDEPARKSYTNKKLQKMDYSISTFNIYLGLNKTFDLDHHNVIFSKDYNHFIKTITNNKLPEDDLSLYIHNPSKIDPSLAPKGKSSLYILVPVPNLDSNTDWKTEKDRFKNLIYKTLEEKTEIKNIQKHIEVEHIITPQNWQDEYHVHKGAVFNLSHKLSQMLYFRPHNQFNNIDNLYLTGGGTHPGSGLPTIYLSALISTKLFEKAK